MAFVVDEPVTPELALVDSELARRARADLPDVAHPAERRGTRSVSGTPGTAPAGQTVERRRWAARRREAFWRGVVPLGSVSAVIASLWLVGLFPREYGRQDLSPASTASAARAALSPSSLSVPSTAPGASSASPQAASVKGAIPVPHQTSTPPDPSSPATPRPQAPPQVPTERSAPSVNSSVAGRKQAFGWVPVRGATHYRVEFFRGRTKIFEARPAVARFELPPRWVYGGRRYRLTPGQYLWVVRPALGPRSRVRYGKPIVRATLIVPPVPNDR